MAMTQFPADNALGSRPNTGEFRTKINDLVKAAKQLFGGDQRTEVTISSGSITIDRASHTVDTESGASTDNLDTISTNNIPDGRVVALWPENTSRAVTIRHGQDNINTSNAENVTLDKSDACIMFQLNGSTWNEVSRTENILSSATDYKLVNTFGITSGEIVIDSGITTDFTDYDIVLDSITVDTDDATLELLVSTDGGSSFKTGASDYQYAAFGRDVSTNRSFENSSDDSVLLTDNAGNLGIKSGANAGLGAQIRLKDPLGTSTKQLIELQHIGYIRNGDNVISYFGQGVYNSAEQVDAIKIRPQSGNIDGGQARLIGKV